MNINWGRLGLTRDQVIDRLRQLSRDELVNSKLDLGRNNLTSLDGVTFPDGLTVLYLHDNNLTSLDGVTFPGGLTVLDLVKNELQEHERVSLREYNNQVEAVTFNDLLNIMAESDTLNKSLIGIVGEYLYNPFSGNQTVDIFL